jgi:intracellular septation protein A
MGGEKEIKELEKARWQSRKAIPVYAGFLIAAVIILWIIKKFVIVPAWITVIVLGLTVLTLLGDIINYIYCGRKLKTLGQEKKNQ